MATEKNEQCAWTRADSDDVWLALDRNGNGKIDNGSELFGNHTPAYAGHPELSAQNGFTALSFLQRPEYGQSRLDDVIDPRDGPFSQLLLWRDRNHNGISEPDELQPIAQTALWAISTEYKRTPRVDRYGNQYLLKGTSWWRQEDGSLEKRPIYDVFLQTEHNQGPTPD